MKLKFFLSVLISLLFTSCGSSDDPKEEKKPTYVRYQTTLAVNPDVVSCFNITAIYTNANGEEKTIAMPSSTSPYQGFTLCVLDLQETANLPASFSLRYNIELSGNVPDVRGIDPQTIFSSVISVSDQDGHVLTNETNSANIDAIGIPIDNIESYIRTFRATFPTQKITVEEDGKIIIK